MKELKTYISEGFFSNVGADNRIKLVIDTIKDASINDKINSRVKKRNKFADSLAPILKDVENNMKKGKIVFEYIRNDDTCGEHKTTISLEISEPNKSGWWIYDREKCKLALGIDAVAFNVATDLYYETTYPTKDPNLRHSIANTIKVIEYKVL